MSTAFASNKSVKPLGHHLDLKRLFFLSAVLSFTNLVSARDHEPSYRCELRLVDSYSTVKDGVEALNQIPRFSPLRALGKMGDATGFLDEVHKKGPAVMLEIPTGPTFLFLSDVESITSVLKDTSKAGSEIEKSTFTTSPARAGGISAQNLFEQSGPEWRSRRLDLQKMFTSTGLRESGMETRIVEVIENRLERMKSDLSQTGSTVDDLRLLAGRLVVEISLKVLFGLEVDDEQLTLIASDLSEVSRIYPSHLVKTTVVKHLRLDRLFRGSRFDGFTRNPSAARILSLVESQLMPMAMGSRSEDLPPLLRLFREKIDQNENPMSNEELKSQLLLFLIASTDSATSSLATMLEYYTRIERWRSWLDAETAHYQTKDEVLTLINTTDSRLSFFLNEAWRLFPPGAALVRRTRESTVVKTPSGPIKLPKNSVIVSSVYNMQRDEATFGLPVTGVPASEFNPSRFEGHSHLIKKLLPFGYGPRSCIGRNFGTLALGYTLVRLSHGFEITRLADGQPSRKSGISPYFDSKIPVRISRRSH